MTSVAPASPLLALADPSFARAGPTGDGFAPVLASLLAPADEAMPVPPAIGKAMPLPGKPVPNAAVLSDVFEAMAPPLPPVDARAPLTRAGAAPPLAVEVAPVLVGEHAQSPHADEPIAVADQPVPVLLSPVGVSPPPSPAPAAPPPDDEAVTPPLAGAGQQPVSRSLAPRTRAAPDADQGGKEPKAAASISVSSLPERKGAPPASLPKSAAVATIGSGSDRPTKVAGPLAATVLQTPSLAPVAVADAPTTTAAAPAAPAAATTRLPSPPAVPVATIEASSIKTDRAPRPARFAPPAREAAPVITDAAPPDVAVTDAPEKGSERDELVAAVEPVPPPSGAPSVVAAAMPAPVALAPTPDPVRKDAVVGAPQRIGRVAAAPLPVFTRAKPVLRERLNADGDRASAIAEPAPAAPAALVASAAPSSDGTTPAALIASVAVGRPAPLRKAAEPTVGLAAAMSFERSVPSVAAVPPAAPPVVARAVLNESLPVAMPEAVARAIGGSVLPANPVLQATIARPGSAMPTEPSPTVAVEPRSENAPTLARVAPVAQLPVELAAAPVILPAFQAFGVQLHRAAAAERRSLSAIDASVLIAPASAPVAVPSEPAPVDVTRPDWPQAMVMRIEQLRERHDEADTRIRLHPDALGAVEVTLRRDEDGTHVRLDAAEPATRALLADAQPRLQALAETRGLRLSGSEVAGGAAQGSTGGWTGNDRRPPAPAPLMPTRRHAADTSNDSTDTRLA